MNIVKECPRCGPGARLVIKVNRRTKEMFLGCERWPACSHTEPLSESIKMQLQGAPRLPELE